jgi:hypothetical protein
VSGSPMDARKSSMRTSLTLNYAAIFRAQSRHMEQCSEGPWFLCPMCCSTETS